MPRTPPRFPRPLLAALLLVGVGVAAVAAVARYAVDDGRYARSVGCAGARQSQRHLYIALHHAAVLSDLRIDQLAPVRLQSRERTFLVCAHETAIRHRCAGRGIV